MSTAPRLTRASDASLLAELGDQVDLATSARVGALARALLRAAPAWLVDVHPAYTSVLVEFDLGAVNHDDVARLVTELAERADGAPAVQGRMVEVPVRYGGDDGPDLEAVAAHAGLAPADVVRLHASARYHVAFVGFLPGFPYLLGLPDVLRTPRLTTPRARVPAGSVAIADRQAGIYPCDSPGGWRIIGRTPRLLDEQWVAPGDAVRFVPVTSPPGVSS